MRQIGRVTATPSSFTPLPLALPPAGAPPYAVTTPTFRFRALASLAGHAQLGGAREVALAMYLMARLADDCRPSKALPPATRCERAGAARTWLGNIALPNAVRSPLCRLAEATEGELPGVAIALIAAAAAARPYLDEAARLELERLVCALSA